MKKSGIIMLTGMLAVSLSIAAASLTSVVADEETVTEISRYTPIGYSFSSTYNVYNYNFTYKDELLFQDARMDSPDPVIVKASAALASVAYSQYGIKNVLTDMGYEILASKNYEDERVSTVSDNDFVQ